MGTSFCAHRCSGRLLSHPDKEWSLLVVSMSYGDLNGGHKKTCPPYMAADSIGQYKEKNHYFPFLFLVLVLSFWFLVSFPFFVIFVFSFFFLFFLLLFVSFFCRRFRPILHCVIHILNAIRSTRSWSFETKCVPKPELGNEWNYCSAFLISGLLNNSPKRFFAASGTNSFD